MRKRLLPLPFDSLLTNCRQRGIANGTSNLVPVVDGQSLRTWRRFGRTGNLARVSESRSIMFTQHPSVAAAVVAVPAKQLNAAMRALAPAFGRLHQPMVRMKTGPDGMALETAALAAVTSPATKEHVTVTDVTDSVMPHC